MVSASLRKSITDLSRRRARTVFTVATLALAVASISFFAIPTLIDASMQEEVRAEKLARRDRDHAAALAHGRAARGARGAPERARRSSPGSASTRACSWASGARPRS